MAKREFVFTVLLIVIGTAGFIYSLMLPVRGSIALSPGLFPGVISLLIIVLSTIHLALSKRKGKMNEEKEEMRNNLFLILSFFTGYMVLLHYIHFLLSTSIFLLATMFSLYKRFYWKIPIISITSVFVVFYLFRYLLNVRLP